jgi:alkylation response protein AidB-like acyl-CoA dehydrogenase
MGDIDVNVLKRERQLFEQFFPGLHSAYLRLDLDARERPNSGIFNLYKQAHGPRLLVPKELGGLHASPLEALAVHRILGALSPSLALGAAMHNFTVAFLVKMAERHQYRGFCYDLLARVASDDFMLASGFAEGRVGVGILESTIQAIETEAGYVINGAKRPCTLSRSMDYLTAGVRVIDSRGADLGRGVAVIAASAPGLSVGPFWKARAFGAAESDEVRLQDITIKKSSLLLIDGSLHLDPAEREAWLWFELLISASYVGVISDLLAQVYQKKKGSALERTRAAADVETAAASLEAIAHAMVADDTDRNSLAARALLVRYGVQKIINDVKNLIAELLGGMQFICGATLEYQIGVLTALAYHPPSRFSAAEAVDAYFSGQPLVLI